MLGPAACGAPLPDGCDRDPDPGLGGDPAPPGGHAVQGADPEPAQVRLSHEPPLRPQRRVSPAPGALQRSDIRSSLVHLKPQTSGCPSRPAPRSWPFLGNRLSLGAACAVPKARGARELLLAPCSVPCAHTAVLRELPGRGAVTP